MPQTKQTEPIRGRKTGRDSFRTASQDHRNAALSGIPMSVLRAALFSGALSELPGDALAELSGVLGNQALLELLTRGSPFDILEAYTEPEGTVETPPLDWSGMGVPPVLMEAPEEGTALPEAMAPGEL